MMRRMRTVALALAAACVAVPASAIVFTVQLTNGSSFVSRYEPVDAPYDASKTVFVDETGLLIALDKSDIASIKSDVETTGFGHVIDNTTLALGWAPNDAPDPGTPEAQNRLASQQAANAGAAEASEEPIYDTESVPPTMQVIPSFTVEGQPYAVPAPSATASPEVEPPPGS